MMSKHTDTSKHQSDCSNWTRKVVRAYVTRGPLKFQDSLNHMLIKYNCVCIACPGQRYYIQ